MENIEEYWSKAREWLALLWNFQLYKSGDNLITFNQVFIAPLLIAVVTLGALPIAGIPITIFTVLRGAVAIGIGFGALEIKLVNSQR